VTTTVAKSTVSEPPPSTSFLMRASRSRLNSMPMVNSRRMTPISDTSSTVSI
jgi:hypothetical protein